MAAEKSTKSVAAQASISTKSKDFGPWSSFLVELQAFKKKFGHANPSEGRLFDWLEHQRSLFERGTNSEMHVSILRDLGCAGLGAEPCMMAEKKCDAPQDSAGAVSTASSQKILDATGSGAAPASASATASSGHSANKGAAGALPDEAAPKGITENKGVGSKVSKSSNAKEISQARALPDTGIGHAKGSPNVRTQLGHCNTDGTLKAAESSKPSSENCEGLKSSMTEDHKVEETSKSSSRDSKASKAGMAGKHEAASCVETGNAQEGDGRENSLPSKLRTVTPVTKNGQETDRPAVSVNKEAVKTTPVHEQVTRKASCTKPTNGTNHQQQGYAGDSRKAHSNSGTISQLNNNDVVCGGGLSFGYNIVINFLPGNVQFRDMVQVQSKYASNEQDENMHAAEEIVMRIGEMNPPGRFVIGAEGAWAEVGKKEAINYVLKVLCEEAGIEDDDNDEVMVEEEEKEGDDVLEDVAVDDTEGSAMVTHEVAEVEMVDNCDESATMDHQSENRPRGHWESRFHMLVEYKNRTGSANPNTSRTSPDIRIGKWLANQRRKFRIGTLSCSKLQRLRNLGCSGFGSDSPQKAGRKPVHVSMTDSENVGLENDCSRGSPRSLAPASTYDEDMAKQRAAFIWLEDQTIVDNFSNTWRANYLALKEFSEYWGHSCPSWESMDPREHHLAGWLMRQKELFDRERLCEEQITLLKYLKCQGFDEHKHETSERSCQHENIEIIRSDPDEEDAAELDKDEETPETERSSGKSVGEDDNQRRLTWEERYSQMVDFKREYGHANPLKSISSSDAESKLGRWLKDQRKIFESGRLAAERVKLLRRLGCDGFETTPDEAEADGDGSMASPEANENEAKVRSHNDSLWEARFAQLLEFKEESGHANPVRSKFAATTEFSLASWVTTQRMKFREGKLDSDKIERLHSVGCKGFVEDLGNHDSVSEDGTAQKAVNPAFDTQWENRYNQLSEFKKKNGHADPKRSQGADRTEFKLGSFLTAQRMKYRDGTLERYRLKKLRGLGCSGFETVTEQQELPLRRTWEQHFENLKEYKEQHGHANPRRSAGPWFELGNWLASQRVRNRKGALRLEKVERLRSLGCSGFDEEDDVIEEPGPNDVVCGRGGHANTWPGNVMFREHVHSRKDEYCASKKHRKMEMSKEVVSFVRQAGGRFLKHDHGVWVEVGDARAIKKASQALREGTLQCSSGGKDSEAGDQDSDDDNDQQSVSHSSSTQDCDEESDKDDKSNEESDGEEDDGSTMDDDSENDKAGEAGGTDEESEDRDTAEERGQNNTVNTEDSDSGESLDEMGRVVENGCVPWMTRYKQLNAYRKRNGHANPGCAKGPDYAIGHWLSDQRYKFRKGTLPLEKTELLNNLGCHGFGLVEYVPDKIRSSREEEPKEQELSGKARKGPAKKRRRLGIEGTNTSTSSPAPAAPAATETEAAVTTTTRSGRASKKKKTDYLFY